MTIPGKITSRDSLEIVIPFKETAYGFKYGAANISRTFSNKKDGSVTLTLSTPKGDLQIYITKTGKVRIYDYYARQRGGVQGIFGEWLGTLTPVPKEYKL